MDIQPKKEPSEVPVEPPPLEPIVRDNEPPRQRRFALVRRPAGPHGEEEDREPRGSLAALDDWLLFRLSERMDAATRQHASTLFQLENTTRELQQINADITRLQEEQQRRNERDRSPRRCHHCRRRPETN